MAQATTPLPGKRDDLQAALAEVTKRSELLAARSTIASQTGSAALIAATQGKIQVTKARRDALQEAVDWMDGYDAVMRRLQATGYPDPITEPTISGDERTKLNAEITRLRSVLEGFDPDAKAKTG